MKIETATVNLIMVVARIGAGGLDCEVVSVYYHGMLKLLCFNLCFKPGYSYNMLLLVFLYLNIKYQHMF